MGLRPAIRSSAQQFVTRPNDGIINAIEASRGEKANIAHLSITQLPPSRVRLRDEDIDPRMVRRFEIFRHRATRQLRPQILSSVGARRWLQMGGSEWNMPQPLSEVSIYISEIYAE